MIVLEVSKTIIKVIDVQSLPGTQLKTIALFPSAQRFWFFRHGGIGWTSCTAENGMGSGQWKSDQYLYKLEFDDRIMLHEIRKWKLCLGENVVNGVLWVI